MLYDKVDTQRESKRKELFYSFEVLDENGLTMGPIGDLTLNGLKIITKTPVELHTVHQLRIKLPERISHNELCFEAKCVWCQKADDSFNIGFQAEHHNPDNIKTIKMIMELLASPEKE